MDSSQGLRFSIIVPVYNRPKETEELLGSLAGQTRRDFEVVIVEDGSQVWSEAVVEQFRSVLDVAYIFKYNTGPGLSRNFGFERARGNYAIFLDSDCVLPPHYFETVAGILESDYTDAFGGPDRAHPSFSTLQKAINYSMTSFFTTGGIRGGGERLDKFYPRSFNMGYSREVFEKTRGFSGMRFGEDIDMSIRTLQNGFGTRLIKEAYVYHKRRTSLKQFFKQVFNSGVARINLYKRHPFSLKVVHLLPAAFTLGVAALVLLAVFVSKYFLLPLLLHAVIIFTDSAIRNRSLVVGLLSVVTSYFQLFGYGTGFLWAVWQRLVLGRDEFAAFRKNFYK